MLGQATLDNLDDYWVMSASDEVPPAKAIHRHPEGKCSGGVGDCREEW